MSKSGLYAHFGSKEELQLATIDFAEDVFDTDVVDPAMESATVSPAWRRSASASCRTSNAVSSPAAASLRLSRPSSTRGRARCATGSSPSSPAGRSSSPQACARRQRQDELDPDASIEQLTFEINAMLAQATPCSCSTAIPGVRSGAPRDPRTPRARRAGRVPHPVPATPGLSPAGGGLALNSPTPGACAAERDTDGDDEVARFRDRCSDLMGALLDELARTPDGRGSSPRSRPRWAARQRRIASSSAASRTPATPSSAGAVPTASSASATRTPGAGRSGWTGGRPRLCAAVSAVAGRGPAGSPGILDLDHVAPAVGL